MILIILGIFVVACIIFWIIWRNTSICRGGKIMQGCGKILFPWTKKIKLPDGKGYCCMECLKRDIDLVTKDIEEGPLYDKIRKNKQTQ